MHKSRRVFTFVLLVSSLVMLSAMPLLNNNTVAMAQGYDYDYDNYYGDNTYSKYSTYDNKYECRTGPFEGFFVSSVEFCKNVKFDNDDDSRKNNRDTGTGPQSFACQNVNIVPNTNTIDVDNTNTNTAAATNTSEPFQQQDKNSNLDTPVNGQQVTPEKILNSLFGNNTNGNGELLNFDICINVNNNNIIQQQQVAAAAGEGIDIQTNENSE